LKLICEREITYLMADGIQRPGASCSGSDGEPRSEYSIDPEKALVFVRFARKLTARDIESYASALKQDPRFAPNLSEIIDLRAVEDIEIAPAQAIALADVVDPFSLSARRAFVIGNDLQANAARMHQMLRSPARNIAIFDSLARAEEWVRSAPPPTHLDQAGPGAPVSRPLAPLDRLPARPLTRCA
jgi:hypothetical protein